MLRWRFRTFVHPSGRTEVQSEVDRLGDYGLADFGVKIRYLAGMAVTDWHEPQARKLNGFRELYEVRFKSNHAATRAIGYFGPSAHEFTILIICTHKQNVYKPFDALQTADKRRRQIADKAAGCAPLTIDGEEFPPADEA